MCTGNLPSKYEMSNAMTEYCFNSDGFCKIANITSPSLNIRKQFNIGFPIHFWSSKYRSISKNYKFICTPICLSGPRTIDELAVAIAQFSKVNNFGGAYIQTRLQTNLINTDLKNLFLIIFNSLLWYFFV